MVHLNIHYFSTSWTVDSWMKTIHFSNQINQFTDDRIGVFLKSYNSTDTINDVCRFFFFRVYILTQERNIINDNNKHCAWKALKNKNVYSSFGWFNLIQFSAQSLRLMFDIKQHCIGWMSLFFLQNKMNSSTKKKM